MFVKKLCFFFSKTGILQGYQSLSLGAKFRSNLFLRTSSMLLLVTIIKPISESLPHIRQCARCFTLLPPSLTKSLWGNYHYSLDWGLLKLSNSAKVQELVKDRNWTKTTHAHTPTLLHALFKWWVCVWEGMQWGEAFCLNWGKKQYKMYFMHQRKKMFLDSALSLAL